MLCVGLDPGAARLGAACVERDGDDYTLVWSDVLGIERGASEDYGDYRRRLIEYWLEPKIFLPRTRTESIVVNERLPAIHTRGQFSTQPLLAQVALACIHFWLSEREFSWSEIGANTVKKAVTGNARATKVGVRNGVLKVFPELDQHKKEWPADRWDAIAIALAGVKYKV